MEKKLGRYSLDYEKAIIYANDQLNCSYPLSNEIFTNIDFKKGQFFTLLPENVDLNRIYEFFGGIYPPKTKLCEATREMVWEDDYFCTIPSISNELANLILHELMNKEYTCVFEDVQQELTDPHIEFYYKFGFSCSNVIYYFMNKDNAKVDEILNGLAECDAQWHQLCILTKINNTIVPTQKISLEEMNDVARNIKLLILGAYDGEGYIFWEPINT